MSRSPRHSLIPDRSLNHRNSLVTLDILCYNRSPRDSLALGVSGSRISLVPENSMSRSPRHSVVPDLSRGSRENMVNIEFDRSLKGSICSEVTRSLRNSVLPLEVYLEKKDRSTRGSIVFENINLSSCESIIPDLSNSSLRNSITPDPYRSPRGSICKRSLGGSVTRHEFLSNRSPRNSIDVGEFDCKNYRSSSGGLKFEDESISRSPHGTIGITSEFDRILGGSLGGLGQDKKVFRAGFTIQEYRRLFVDQDSSKNQRILPYRQRGEILGSVRSGETGGAQVNIGYGTTNSWIDSRRASSSVSQFSVDESRRLCGANPNIIEKGSSTPAGPTDVAAYGSLVFQLKDAHLEANSTCNFVFRGLRVFSKTMIVTVFLAFLSTMPIFMLILGAQFIRDCPREPHIPVYIVVRGTLGGFRMFWILYSQIRSRRPEVLIVSGIRPHISLKKLGSVALSCFLVAWFALDINSEGNQRARGKNKSHDCQTDIVGIVLEQEGAMTRSSREKSLRSSPRRRKR